MRFNNVVACGRNTLICIKHTPSGGESANNAEMDATQILDAYIKAAHRLLRLRGRYFLASCRQSKNETSPAAILAANHERADSQMAGGRLGFSGLVPRRCWPDTNAPLFQS